MSPASSHIPITDQRVRASDADRDQVIVLLREHAAQGRLTLGEFTERMSRVCAAVTLKDLAGLTAGLPAGLDPAGTPANGVPGAVPWLLPAIVACCAAVIIAVQVAFHRDPSAGVPATIIVLTACCLAHRRSS
jgi:hypothetical protein